MGEGTKIQWTDATVNFWTGCKKVSEGCRYCYMYRDKERYGLDPKVVVKVKDKTINTILKKLTGTPSKIFTCSWSDFFIEEADQWRDWAWDIIRAHPQHQWQILTKRPERIKQCLPADWGEGWPNVWLGVSIESDEVAEERISMLAEIPAKIRFLSMEPLIGPITVSDKTHFNADKIHWVIIGGESGNDAGVYRYRPCKYEWIEKLIVACRLLKIPVFMKQTGTLLAKESRFKDRSGGDIREWHEGIKVREFPTIS